MFIVKWSFFTLGKIFYSTLIHRPHRNQFIRNIYENSLISTLKNRVMSEYSIKNMPKVTLILKWKIIIFHKNRDKRINSMRAKWFSPWGKPSTYEGTWCNFSYFFNGPSFEPSYLAQFDPLNISLFIDTHFKTHFLQT